MKKLLEVLIDEKNGELHFSTEHPLETDVEKLMKHPEKAESMFKMAIKSMIKCGWEDKDYTIYPIVRVLSMAEIMSCAQPYEQAEEFWSTMMFSFIPQHEKFANRLKKPFGVNPKDIVRPITFGGPFSMFRGGSFPIQPEDEPDLTVN